MPKIGVVHYNFPNFSFDDFLRYCAENGFQYVELAVPTFWDPDLKFPLQGAAEVKQQSEYTRKVRAKVESYGITVGAVSAQNDFLQVDPGAIEYQVARMRDICEQATLLCPGHVVRTEGGSPKEEIPQERWGEALLNCFTRCPDMLEELDVTLAIDNHGLVSNDGDLLLKVLQTLDNPRIGSNLDTMNFRWAGHSVETCNRFYRELAPYVKSVHLKDGTGSRENYRGAALGEGEIDLQVALEALKAAGYQGVYHAEYEGPELEGGVGYAKCLQWMKQNIMD